MIIGPKAFYASAFMVLGFDLRVLIGGLLMICFLIFPTKITNVGKGDVSPTGRIPGIWILYGKNLHGG